MPQPLSRPVLFSAFPRLPCEGDSRDFRFGGIFNAQQAKPMITIKTENTLLREKYAPTTSSLHSTTGRANGEIPADEILAELDRIVGSADFRASERNRRVLQYLVRCALEGRELDITAYKIATHVYGRPETFNALKDPIVRIEMARLRRDLEMYYLKSGRANPLRLNIPKGRYVPTLTRAGEAGAEPGDASTASPFLLSVLRAALCACSGAGAAAAAAWQDLLLADPNLLANLQDSVRREVGDEEVTRLIVEGVLRAARQTT